MERLLLTRPRLRLHLRGSLQARAAEDVAEAARAAKDAAVLEEAEAASVGKAGVVKVAAA